MDVQDLKEQGSHFEFGDNWQRYSKLIDDGRISDAIAGLEKLCPGEVLDGKSFLDIGCGSGLHSLAALRLGADRVEAVDIDPKSVETTRSLLERYAEGADFVVRRSSVFDLRNEAPGQFDVVYSWGVLHHTGAMNEAVAAAAALVKPGGWFAFALYRKTWMCRFWAREKRWYSRTSPGNQGLALSLFVLLFRINMRLSQRSFRSYLAEYDKNSRGMDFFHDVHDWMGGYPYESISPLEVDRTMNRLGFDREKAFLLPDSIPLKIGLFGSGNDEYVYRKRG
jgi:SAM-dependent methyltransferase